MNQTSKLIIVILIFFIWEIAYGIEKNDSNIKSYCFISKNKRKCYEYDKSGKTIFSCIEDKSISDKTIFANEYDSLNRLTTSYTVYKRFGFSLEEIIYKSGYKEHYLYYQVNVKSFPYEYNTLKMINNFREFTQMRVFQELKKGNKYLSQIDIFDSVINTIKEIKFSIEGDTTSISYRNYNSNNKEIQFHHESKGIEQWKYDIYFFMILII